MFAVRFFLISLLAGLMLASCASESRVQTNMTGSALSALIQKFDDGAEVADNSVRFTVQDREIFLVFDSEADRMRLITPIAQASSVDHEIYLRMLQANYDAVLDARYAVANDIIWAVYIHPLSSLTEDDFLSAVAQTVTSAETFGGSYTSGAIVFGGGDSNTIHEELLKALEEATQGPERDI